MEGLPQNLGALGLAMAVLGLAIGLAYLLWQHPFRADRSALVVVAIGAAAIASFPYVSWRIVEDVRYTSALNSWIANRYGVSVDKVHPAIFDNAAFHMPEHARYFLASSPRINGTRREAFAQWAVGWLLPRVAVATPSRADFVLTLGESPRSVDPKVTKVWRVFPAVEGTPAAYLGRVSK